MKRWLWRTAAFLTGLVLVLVAAGIIVLRSQWFLDHLKTRIVEVAEKATGGKVQIGKLGFDWSSMQARAEDFELRGKEAPDEPPLVRVESVTLGLRIISAVERDVDLQSLKIVRPQVHLIVYPDQTTNIPGVSPDSDRLWSQSLLNLKVGSYEISDGLMHYENRRIPFAVRGENLAIRLTYDGTAPSYSGELSSDALSITPPGYAPILASIDTRFTLEQNRVRFASLNWAAPNMTAKMSGDLEDLRDPHGTFAVQARSTMSGLVREFRLPVNPAGSVTFNGNLTVSFAEQLDYQATGAITGQNLRFVQDDRMRVENVSVQAQATASPAGATLRQIRIQALDATATGELRLDQWRDYRFSGELAGLNLRRSVALLTDREPPWDGAVTGTVELTGTLGQPDLLARSTFTVEPIPDTPHFDAHVDLDYDQARGTIALGSSSVATRATRLEFEGTLGQTLRVRARTTSLDDLQPALTFVRGAAAEFPLRLNNGSVSLDGTVTGSLEDPQFRGQLSVVNAQVGDYQINSFSTTDLTANQREVNARGITAARGRTTAAGDAALSFRPGASGAFSNSEIVAQLRLQNVDVAEVAKEAGLTEPLQGTASADVRISGSIERPEISAKLDVQNPKAMGEVSDRLRADVRYVPGRLELTGGILNDAGSEIQFGGTFTHPPANWRSGNLTFEASSRNLPTARIEHVGSIEPKVSAILSGTVKGSGTLDNSSFTPTSATANTTIRQIVVGGQSIGDITLLAETQGTKLAVSAQGNVQEVKVQADGQWTLEGDAPGQAKVTFSQASVATLHKLVMMNEPAPPPSVGGYVAGEAMVSVPLNKPREFKADVTLTEVLLRPLQNPAERFGLTADDVILRNSAPVRLALTSEGAQVLNAKFIGRDSPIDVSGSIPFSDAGANLNVNGSIDLAILQVLRDDLLATGKADVNVTIRGSLQEPTINGRLQLNDASLFLKGLTNGVDHATGTIQFDRRQASTQSLTAEVGGGKVEFRGSLEFTDPLVYKLTARTLDRRGMRVRYPQNASNTFTADLNLVGTSEASRLSGTVNLVRTGLTINTDLLQLVAEASEPTPALDVGNEYLNGMRLDIVIRNAPEFEFETSDASLANNVEADVDLRVVGTPARPVVRGNITVNRGEAQVLGNRYTVDRGEIRFLNPVKTEPTVDLDLSTRAGAYTVNVSVTGKWPKVQVNFAADPPLQTAEIVRLLSVGGDPASAIGQLAPGASGSGASALFMQAGGNMVGQAVTAQVSNTFQRFFGASRVKIDPTLTGVDNLPQARLTVEQQVSQDIRLTFITNLNRTQEQVVRVQWDLSKDWSAIAVRDANGVFGVDFQFRKRF